MRITTRSIMQTYNYNLGNALKNWNTAQNKVLTQRNFSTISEDPSSAIRSFKLRQQFRNNNMQLEMAQQAESLLDQAVSSTMQISDIMCNTVNPDILKAVNGTNSSLDVRKSYAASLRGMAESIVLAANSQISGRYVFGGASTKEVPFEMDADGNLTYRGVNVNATDTDLYLNDSGDPIFIDANGDTVAYDSYTIEDPVYYDADGNELVKGTDYDEIDADGNLIKHHVNEPVTYDHTEKEYTFYKADGTELRYRVDYDKVDANGVPSLFGTDLKAGTDYDATQTNIETVYIDSEGNKLVKGVDYTDVTANPAGDQLFRTNDEVIEYAKKETDYTVKDADGNTIATATITEDADGNVTSLEGVKSQKQVLDEMAKEALYLDTGFGLEQDANGNVVSTSAYNAAITGLSMLGYGQDANGTSNNVVVLLGQMADVLEQETFSEGAYTVLMTKYEECIDQITDFESTLGTKQSFLEGTITRLEQYNDSINDRVVDLEQVDMAEAISTYTWMGYAYNAALKVGTDIVSNSLLDYMK